MAIVGVLATLALPRYRAHVARARMAEAKVNLGTISSHQKAYRFDGMDDADTPYRDKTTGYHRGLHYGLDKCSDTASEAKNELGFRLSDCSKSRYRYITNLGDDCAKSDGSIAQGQVYPNCIANDEWHVNIGGVLTHADSVMKKCPDATSSSSSSSSCSAVLVSSSTPTPTPTCMTWGACTDDGDGTCSKSCTTSGVTATQDCTCPATPACTTCTAWLDNPPAYGACSGGQKTRPPYNKTCSAPSGLSHCTQPVLADSQPCSTPICSTWGACTDDGDGTCSKSCTTSGVTATQDCTCPCTASCGECSIHSQYDCRESCTRADCSTYYRPCDCTVVCPSPCFIQQYSNTCVKQCDDTRQIACTDSDTTCIAPPPPSSSTPPTPPSNSGVGCNSGCTCHFIPYSGDRCPYVAGGACLGREKCLNKPIGTSVITTKNFPNPLNGCRAINSNTPGSCF